MHDDRITSVELDDRVIYEMMEVETKNWIENVIQTAAAIYDPTPEYLDREWLDKNNY